jgi:hypothetical protein
MNTTLTYLLAQHHLNEQRREPKPPRRYANAQQRQRHRIKLATRRLLATRHTQRLTTV